MATLIERYVNTASVGGDGTTNNTSGATAAFASMDAALDAIFAATPDFVASDIQVKLWCEGTAADTVQVNFSNHQFTTDATRFLWILTDPSKRHPGAYSTSHYRLIPTAISIGITNVNCDVVFEGLQVEIATALSGNPQAITLLSTGTKAVTVRECVLFASGSGTPSSGWAIGASGTSARKLYAINNVIHGGWSRGIQMQFVSSGGKLVAYNNTIVGVYQAGIQAGSNAASTTYFKNNRIDTPTNSGAGGVCFSYSSTTLAGTGGNYSGDATSPDGAGNRSKTFTWEDAGANNYHIVTGDTFTGDDLSADTQFAFAVDIDGDARTSWYAGADEFTAAGPTYVDRSAFFDPPSGGGGAGPRIGGGRIVS